jgi:cytochrome c-type biogenesis protein
MSARRLLIPTLALAAFSSNALAASAGDLAVPGLAAAFLGGIISFLSPCCLPLVPSYLSVLGASGKPLRGALGFVLGFSLVFVALGASASALGGLLAENRTLLTQVGGGLITFFGLVLLGVIRIPALTREYRADLGGASRYGMVALGAAFAAGWTPCIGLVLGPILTLAADTADVGRGVLLLAVYAAGLAVPFLLAAVAWERLAHTFRRAGRFHRGVEIVGGGILVVVGVLMLSNNYGLVNAAMIRLTPEWLQRML